MVFPELCHGCGLCSLVCPQEAISEEPREIGVIKKGRSGDGTIDLVYGLLNIGEVKATPLIDHVKAELNPAKAVIIDAPPGTACPVIAAVQSTDYCILPFGIVVNKAGIGDRKVYEYCAKEGIPILLEIPHDKRIARYYSEGVPFVSEMPEWEERFAEIIGSIYGTTRLHKINTEERK